MLWIKLLGTALLLKIIISDTRQYLKHRKKRPFIVGKNHTIIPLKRKPHIYLIGVIPLIWSGFNSYGGPYWFIDVIFLISTLLCLSMNIFLSFKSTHRLVLKEGELTYQDKYCRTIFIDSLKYIRYNKFTGFLKFGADKSFKIPIHSISDNQIVQILDFIAEKRIEKNLSGVQISVDLLKLRAELTSG